MSIGIHIVKALALTIQNLWPVLKILRTDYDSDCGGKKSSLNNNALKIQGHT